MIDYNLVSYIAYTVENNTMTSFDILMEDKEFSKQANKAFLKADHNNYEELAIQLTTYANNNLI